jgi:hypothetical protein
MAVEVESVGTIANLVATVVPVAEKLVWVQRYRMMQTNGQEYVGGGGWLRWDESETGSDDGGTIFASMAPDPPPGGWVGRWKRDQVKDALDFGADPTYDLTSLNNATPNTGPDSSDALFNYLSWAEDNQQAVVIPKGVFYLSKLNKVTTILPGGTTLTAFFKITNPTVVGAATRTVLRGAGMQNTILVIDPSKTGDVFQIEECWRRSGLVNVTHYAPNSEAPNQTANQGVSIEDLSMVSKDGCAARGIVTIGRVDELRLRNLQCSWLGTALSLGMELVETATDPPPATKLRAHVRESSFSNLHLLHCGRKDTNNQMPTMPALEMGSGAIFENPLIATDSAAGGDGTNHLFFDQCSIVYPEGLGLSLENKSALDTRVMTNAPQLVKVRRIRFTNLLLVGASAKTTTPQVKAPVMRIKGFVDDVMLVGGSLSGSSSLDQDYACLLFEEFDASNRPRHVQILADLRATAGRGIDVQPKGHALMMDLTVDQASLGTSGNKPAVNFAATSILDLQPAWVRALSRFVGPPPGARVDIEAGVQDSVAVERSSGGITGAHKQRRLEGTTPQTTNTTLTYNDETLVVISDRARTVTLPKFSELTPGRRFYVVDGSGGASSTNKITIQAQSGEELEGVLGGSRDIVSAWGKRVFQYLEVEASRWVSWEL